MYLGGFVRRGDWTGEGERTFEFELGLWLVFYMLPFVRSARYMSSYSLPLKDRVRVPLRSS